MLFRLLCVCFYLGALRSTATVADRQEVRKTSVTFILLISTVLGISSTLGASKKSSVLFQWNLIGGKLGTFMLDRFNLKERHQYPLSMKIGGFQSRC